MDGLDGDFCTVDLRIEMEGEMRARDAGRHVGVEVAEVSVHACGGFLQ